MHQRNTEPQTVAYIYTEKLQLSGARQDIDGQREVCENFARRQGLRINTAFGDHRKGIPTPDAGFRQLLSRAASGHVHQVIVADKHVLDEAAIAKLRETGAIVTVAHHQRTARVQQ